MCKTSFKVTVFYDGTRTAKEVLNDAIAAKDKGGLFGVAGNIKRRRDMV